MTPPRAAFTILLLLATAVPSGVAAQTINDCTFGDPSIVDWLDVPPAQRVISFVCCSYTPPCTKIEAGQITLALHEYSMSEIVRAGSTFTFKLPLTIGQPRGS